MTLSDGAAWALAPYRHCLVFAPAVELDDKSGRVALPAYKIPTNDAPMSALPTIMLDLYAPLAADASVLFILIAIVVHYVQGKRRLAPLPPGPKPWPIVGNAWDFPTTHEGRFFVRHREVYGTWQTSSYIA